MLDYFVEKRIDIATQAESAINFLADYRNWPQWSPWLIMEPECKLDYRGEQGNIGDGYQWDGDLVGAGEMTLMTRSATQLDMHLSFQRPFKSEAKVSLQAVQMGNNTEVRWSMKSKVPWYLFFLKGLFQTMIGMDYERGLKMLKSALETGEVHSRLKLIGERTQDEIHYVGVRGSGTIAELGPQMQAHFSELNQLIETKGLEIAGPPFALYHSMKMKQQFFEFTTCFPVRQKVEVAKPFETGTLASCETYVVEHTGEYPFMGNAWSMAMNASRHYKVKVKHRPLGIERYLNDPRENEAKDLVTEVVLFKK
ncbi:hypothetical protein JCM19239_3200 [Vibrio variabilis]|uniref:AraC effector-binding domain-containing protein n=1 Tax=Vibrio variabilis TaxID=990271 RepID=A0ABQ0JIC8_9VIBR|nr:hypothetical protein JCM19239_3200 [Vibrio variabilis]